MSVINWFYVGNSIEARGQPKRLSYTLVSETSITPETSQRALDLMQRTRHEEQKFNFSDTWKIGQSQTRMEKVLLSMRAKMSPLQKEEASVPDTQDKENSKNTIQSDIIDPEQEESKTATAHDGNEENIQLQQANETDTTLEQSMTTFFDMIIKELNMWNQ
jgi:hypothetical protein